jgi:hypothetical protein
MNTLADSVKPTVFRDGEIIISVDRGREIRFPVARTPRLTSGTPKQLAHIELSPYGSRWPDLDENLSLRSLLAGDYGQK